MIKRPKLLNTPVSFLSGVLSLNAYRKKHNSVLTSKLGVVDRHRSQKLSTQVKVAVYK